jgi:hypothetical protein
MPTSKATPLAYCQKGHLLARATVEDGEARIRYSAAVAHLAGQAEFAKGHYNYKAHDSYVAVAEIIARASESVDSYELMCPMKHGAQVSFRLDELIPVIQGKSRPVTIKV